MSDFLKMKSGILIYSFRALKISKSLILIYYNISLKLKLIRRGGEDINYLMNYTLQLPDSVNHTELKERYLGASEIVFYPPLSGIRSQANNSNNLTKLDSRISKLKNLRVLNLIYNQLTI